jgi:DNA-binding beta-propeller fold protein YncE
VSDDFPPAFGEFAIGSQIAGYRLEEQIGRGGMAVVYRAYDPRLDRRVALKILAPGLALDEAFRQRFIRESRAAAAVDHPNIIPVFDAGEANGVLFIAMRFVHGRDVRTLLDAVGPLPAQQVANITSQVASALDAAHARGLVHRDVKPGNMLLDTAAAGGGHDHVYLSDFGLSKQSLAQTALTSQGQFLGTLDYVAPEQVEGRKVDGRADLYALACAAFELLSGAPPFKRDGGLAVVWAKLSEVPPRLSQRRAGLPVAVDDVMSRALAKAPAERYGSCGEFARALRDALGLRGSGIPGWPPPRTPTQIVPAVGFSAPPGDAGTGVAAASGSGPPPPAAGPDASAAAAGRPGPPADTLAAPPGPDPASGPPTEAAQIPRISPTRPGLTEPSARGTAEPGPRAAGAVIDPALRPPWLRSRALMSAAAAVVVVGVVAAAVALHHGGTSGGGSNGGVATIKPPGCTTEAARAGRLSQVRSNAVALGNNPFGVAVTADGKYSFVATGNAIAVLTNNGGSTAPTQIAAVPAPGAKKTVALTADGRYLLAVEGNGAYVISVAKAEEGADSGAMLGTITGPPGNVANEVLASTAGFAFITFQNDGDVAVFNLSQAIAGGFGNAGYRGLIRLGAQSQPQGMALSPDGRWLYVTGESHDGRLYVVDTRQAEKDPLRAVRSSAAAGCASARVVVSADGSDVWVTDRDSNALVAFSAARLLSDPAQALTARVGVGQTPLGLSFVDGGKQIAVADANLHNVPGADNLALISTQQALQGNPGALLGFISTGLVPRELTTEAAGTLLVTDFGSGRLQAIDAGSLP